MGGHLDSNLTFKEHILTKCKASTLDIIKIQNIRKYLTKDTFHKIILQLVTSHLDYANSMLTELISSSIKIMQKNTTTRLIFGKKCQRKHHGVPQKLLLWLPIQQRIDFKICTLIHKCCKQKAPVYLQNLIQEQKKNQIVPQ